MNPKDALRFEVEHACVGKCILHPKEPAASCKFCTHRKGGKFRVLHKLTVKREVTA